jgi:hypothetical protein
MFFNQAVKNYKQVAAPHFFKIKFGFSGFAINPSVGNPSIGVIPCDGFKRKLYRQVEMGCQEGAQSLNGFSLVDLESVGDIVVFEPEQDLNSDIYYAVTNQSYPWIVDSFAALNEP